jgi:hypothetical protein
LGFGSWEADQCLRDHKAETSVGCRAAVARTEALYRALEQQGEAPHPPGHGGGGEDGEAGNEGGRHTHPALLYGALLVALLVGCGVARRRRRRRHTRRRMRHALHTLERHPALKARLEDAAGVALPSYQWQLKVSAALAANPSLTHALASAEKANAQVSECASADEPQQQLAGLGYNRHHGYGGPHFDPFHGGPPPHHGQRRRRCAKRLAAVLLLLVAASAACYALRGGKPGGEPGADGEAHSDANPGGEGRDGLPPPPSGFAGAALALVAAAVAVCGLKACRAIRRTQVDEHVDCASAELVLAVPTNDDEQGLTTLSKGAQKAAAALYFGASEAAKATQAAAAAEANAVVVVSVRVPGLRPTF